MNALDKDDDHEFRTPLWATTLAAVNEAGAKEQKRLKDRVPPTLLDPGETVIVPHWEVSRIWNYAMKAYMRLEALGHGSTVYGETSGWDIAEGFLKCSSERLVPLRRKARIPTTRLGGTLHVHKLDSCLHEIRGHGHVTSVARWNLI